MLTAFVKPIDCRRATARADRAPAAQWTRSGVLLSGTTDSMRSSTSPSGTSVADGMCPSFHSSSSRTSMIR